VATGAVVPRDEVLIKPQISGIVKHLKVEAGQTVSEGDILAVVQVVPNMANLNAAENRINRAQINLDNVKLDYNRNSSLLEKGVISQADFQPFSMNKMNAEQELRAAQENLQIVQNGVAKRNRGGSNTDIRSTVSGMILDVPIKVGNSVIEANTFNEGTTVATIANMKDLIFEGKIDESEVEKLKEGMELILTIGAIEGVTFRATLEYISPKGIEENGAVQFSIKAAVSLDENQFVRAGYSATADVVLDKREDVMAISESLLQFEKDGSPYVEVKISENEYDKRTVELGLSDGIYVEVLKGVKAEDEIKAWNSPVKSF
jgi:HlyD family secretion protein